MSVATQDKVYLFAKTPGEIYTAIEQWFEVMSTPTAEELANLEIGKAAEARWRAKGSPTGDDEDYTLYVRHVWLNPCYISTKDQDRELFDSVEIRSHCSEYGHTHGYWRAVLQARCNHKVSMCISRSVPLFAAAYPDIGIEYCGHCIEGDEHYYTLGMEAGWSRSEAGNGREWFDKHVFYTEAELDKAEARRALDAEHVLEHYRQRKASAC